MMRLEKSMDSISLSLDKIIAHNELLRKREIEHLRQIEELTDLLSAATKCLADANNFIADIKAQKND